MSTLLQTQQNSMDFAPTFVGPDIHGQEKAVDSEKTVLKHIANCRELAPSQYEIAPVSTHIATAMLHLSLQKETFEADLHRCDTDNSNSKIPLAKYEKVANQIASVELFVIIALIHENLRAGESLLNRDFVTQCNQLRYQFPKGDRSVDSLVNWFGKLQAEANCVKSLGLDNVTLLAPADNELRRNGISFFIRVDDQAFPATVVPAEGNNANFVEVNDAMFTTINQRIESLNESPEKNVLGIRRSSSTGKIELIDIYNWGKLSSLYKFLREKGLNDNGRLDSGKYPEIEIKGTMRKWFKIWHYLSPKQGIKLSRQDRPMTQFCKIPTVIYFPR